MCQIWRIRSIWKQGNALLARNSWTDNAVYMGALLLWSSKDPVFCNFYSNSHHPISQTVDFKKIFLIHCDTRWFRFFMNYPARTGKNDDNFRNFLLLMSYRLRWVPFSLYLSVSVSYLGNQLSSHLMTQLRQFSSVSSSSTISADTSFRRAFLSSFKTFGTIFAHDVLLFKSCVTIGCIVHSLILSSSAIIPIVKHRSWQMKTLTQSTFCFVWHGRDIQIAVHLPTFLNHYKVFVSTEYLSTW
jgi:hypothetical protein